MHIQKEENRILEVHSRKRTSEDESRKSRSGQCCKIKKKSGILRISELLSKVYTSIHSYSNSTE
jgi:hypothetical protein